MSVNGAQEKCIHINLSLLYKYFYLLFSSCLLAANIGAQETIQLVTPQTESTTVYFQKSTCVRFEFRQQGAVIRFTSNGEEPDENSPVYSTPICITRSAIVKAKSFAAGFLPSSVITVKGIKAKSIIRTIEGSAPETPYNKNGLKTLYDFHSGSHSSKEGWLGYRKDTLEWKVQVTKKTKPKKINIGLMQSQRSWIFYPAKIELVSFEGEVLGVQTFTSEVMPDEKNVFSFSVKKKISGLIIRVQNYSSLPDWHSGKGNKPWFFIDEIAVE